MFTQTSIEVAVRPRVSACVTPFITVAREWEQSHWIDNGYMRVTDSQQFGVKFLLLVVF